MISLSTDSRPQGNHSATGVVLRRRESSGKSQDILLFLKGQGTVWVGAPGADGAKNRFGGGIEPLVWSNFVLYQSPKRLYIKSVDIKEDFLSIRRSPTALKQAILWAGELAKRLPTGHESDRVLSLFWDSMNYLALGVTPELIDCRFVWRWGSIWGLAPELTGCFACENDIDGEELYVKAEDGLLCADCRNRSPELVGRSSGTVSGSAIKDAQRAALLKKEDFMAFVQSCDKPKSAIAETTRWLYGYIQM